MSERFGWYAYAPADAADLQDTAPDVRCVLLRRETHAGPFWSDEEHLSDDFEELHAWLGISRELYDDAMAWNEDYASLASTPSEAWEDAHFARAQDLLRRLRAEVPSGIRVPEPRETRPVELRLSDRSLDVAILRLPPDLASRLTTWRAEGEAYDHATGQNDAAIFAWEDTGSALAREIQAALRDGYVVSA
ncbi:hypothetical protein [Nocardioides pacificus]